MKRFTQIGNGSKKGGHDGKSKTDALAFS